MLYEINSLLADGQLYKEKLLDDKPTIHPTSTIRKSLLGSWTDIGPRVSVVESEVGDYTYFAGDASAIYCSIGKFCSIASHVRINPGNHPMWRVTQHHCTYRRVQYGFGLSDDEQFFNWRRENSVEIGHDVWLGHGVIIMSGVKVGTGCVVGSGAVVTKDLPPYSIAVGVPARVIKMRFEDEIIDKIMCSKWWNWDRKMLKEKFDELLDLDEFIKNNCE